MLNGGLDGRRDLRHLEVHGGDGRPRLAAPRDTHQTGKPMERKRWRAMTAMDESVLRALWHDAEAELKAVTAQRDKALASLAQKDMDTRDMDEYDARWFALHDEIDRLVAELADPAHADAVRFERNRALAAEAAVARVRAILADPPVPSRMLIPVIRHALDGAE